MKRFAKKLAAVLLAAGILSGSFGLTPSADSSGTADLPRLQGDEYVEAAQSRSLRLMVQPSTGYFFVEDLATGQKTHSNPEDAQNDPAASGYNRMTMQSAFEISYISKAQVTDITNSLVSSVRKNGFCAYSLKNGVRFVYEMPEIGITVPLEVTLLDDCFEVSVLAESITEAGDYSLLTLTPYPFLGAATRDESGYLVLPDGCGALIDFEAGEASACQYSYRKSVYGGNAVNTPVNSVSLSETLQLPVFGICTQTRGLLGIVTSGDALADLEVSYKGSSSSCSVIHPLFRYRGTTTRTLFDSSWDRKKITILANEPAKTDAFTVRYYPTGETDYTKMAKQAAEYFGSSEGERTPADAAISVSVLGAVRKMASVFGIPVQKVFAVNDYDAVAAIVKNLQSAGVGDLRIFYQGAFSGGLYDKMPANASLERKLGSAGKRRALLEALDDGGVPLYAEIDLSRIYKTGNGIFKQWNGSRDFSGSVKELTEYSPVTTYAATVNPLTWTVVRAAMYDKIYAGFVKKFNKYGFSGVVDSGTDAFASDHPHGKASTDASAAVRLQKEAIAAHTDGIGYLVRNAAAYLLPYADGIADAPFISSRNDGFSREIPFYSLVAGEFASITATELNNSEDTDGYLLRCLEYGMLPSAYLSLTDTSALNETSADGFFAADSEAMTGRLAELTAKAGSALETVKKYPLSSHSATPDGVFISTYADGTRIYGNRSGAEITVDGVTVPANGFTSVSTERTVS